MKCHWKEIRTQGFRQVNHCKYTLVCSHVHFYYQYDLHSVVIMRCVHAELKIMICHRGHFLTGLVYGRAKFNFVRQIYCTFSMIDSLLMYYFSSNKWLTNFDCIFWALTYHCNYIIYWTLLYLADCFIRVFYIIFEKKLYSNEVTGDAIIHF